MAASPKKVASEGGLGWQIHPLADESWLKSALLIVLVVALSLAAGIGFEDPFYGLFSLGVLTASLSRYWLPTYYHLDEQGVWTVHLGWRGRRRWCQFRRMEICDQGIFLSPFLRPTRLDAFRGILLRCRANDRDEIARYVRRHVATESA